MADAVSRLNGIAEQLLEVPLPVRIRAWDGSQAGPPGAPTLVVRHHRALRRLMWKPGELGELGLARAWVAGDLDIEGGLDIEGDRFGALDLLAGLVGERGERGEGAAVSRRPCVTPWGVPPHVRGECRT